MKTNVRQDRESKSAQPACMRNRRFQEDYRSLSQMISLPTRHNILSTHIPNDSRPYHIPSRSTGFIVPTHNETPPPQHSNTRTVCAPSQYIVNIGFPWRHKHIQSTDRVGLASSQVALAVRAKCPCSGHALPTLNSYCPRSAIATQYTTHIVCRT